jgi:nicotinamide-nucleotide amidase
MTEASGDLSEAMRLADVAHSRMVERGATVAVAESLTGGLISAVLTAAPGTSVTFRGGLVVYSTDLKHSLAGVDQDLLDECGAVHPVVAEKLAAGARERLDAQYGIGATGVAGPGEQDGRPVGEVHIAIASESGVEASEHHFEGGRDEIRLATVEAVLKALIAALENGGATEGADS